MSAYAAKLTITVYSVRDATSFGVNKIADNNVNVAALRTPQCRKPNAGL